MPVSEDKLAESYQPKQATATAVLAQSLYLINLLLVPGIAFAFLLLLYFLKRKQADPFTLNHLQQTVFATLWAGLIIFAVLGFILLLGGVDGPYVWMIAIMYFTLAHSSFIILGMIGLIKALAGQCWRYPLIGKTLPDGC
jgi:uncharacterized Tic20 family protein